MNADRDREIFSAFGRGTSLAELDALSLEAIIKAAVKHTFNKDEIVCLEGEPCPGLMIVESGWLRGERISPQGREQETRLAGPGQMLNEVSVMAGGNNLVTVKSLETSVVWLIGREILFDLISKHPLLSNTIAHNLANHIVYLLGLVEDLALRNVDGRLARLLLDRYKDGAINQRKWSTQAEMAACIGTTPVIVSRVLNNFKDRGAIRIEHHQIIILDHKMLESIEFLEYK